MTPAQRSRLRTTPYLLRALIPLAVLVIGLVVIVWPRDAEDGGVHEVDPAPVIAQARSLAPFALLAPAQSGPGALPGGWRATSARIEAPQTAGSAASISAGAFAFRIGYITPDGMFAQYQQSNDSSDALLAAFGPRTESGDVQVEGDSWRQGERRDNGETLLYRAYADPNGAGTVTLIVTGNASLADLRTLAGSLV